MSAYALPARISSPRPPTPPRWDGVASPWQRWRAPSCYFAACSGGARRSLRVGRAATVLEALARARQVSVQQLADGGRGDIPRHADAVGEQRGLIDIRIDIMGDQGDHQHGLVAPLLITGSCSASRCALELATLSADRPCWSSQCRPWSCCCLPRDLIARMVPAWAGGAELPQAASSAITPPPAARQVAPPPQVSGVAGGPALDRGADVGADFRPTRITNGVDYKLRANSLRTL